MPTKGCEDDGLPFVEFLFLMLLCFLLSCRFSLIMLAILIWIEGSGSLVSKRREHSNLFSISQVVVICYDGQPYQDQLENSLV